jgi:hypothetical protein
VKYLEENTDAIKIKLSKEDEADIRRAIESVGGSKGARYPEMMLKKCFGESPEL